MPDALQILGADEGSQQATPAAQPQNAGLLAGLDVQGLAKGALDAAPAIGGIGGGIAGGGAGTVFGMGVGGIPGAVGGAALGGAGGEAARQLGYRALGLPAPETTGEALKRIGIEGGMQGVGELTGLGATKALGKLARPLMQAALKASPEIAQTAIDEGITATKQGMQKLMNRLGEQGIKAKQLADLATRHGVPMDAAATDAAGNLPSVGGMRKLAYQPMDLARKTWNDLMPGIKEQAHVSGDANKLWEFSRDFLMDHQGEMTPSQMLAMRTRSYKIADPVFKALANDNQVGPGELLRAQWHKQLAKNITDVLHNDIPGLQDIDQTTGDLAKLKNVLSPVSRKSMSFGARMAGRSIPVVAGAGVGAAIPGSRVQHTLEGAGIGAVASSPELWSKVALLSQHPALAKLIPSLFQAPAAALSTRAGQ